MPCWCAFLNVAILYLAFAFLKHCTKPPCSWSLWCPEIFALNFKYFVDNFAYSKAWTKGYKWVGSKLKGKITSYGENSPTKLLCALRSLWSRPPPIPVDFSRTTAIKSNTLLIGKWIFGVGRLGRRWVTKIVLIGNAECIVPKASKQIVDLKYENISLPWRF